MHSRLFQLSLEPIEESDFIEEYDLEDCFIGQIADYAVESDDKIGDIKWLDSVLKPHGAIIDHEKKTIFFPEGFKISYFKKKYESFKEAVDSLTIEKFAGVSERSGMDMYIIKSLLEDKFGFYIYVDYPQTLDDFVRYLEENKMYYIGNIMDYHA